MSMRLGLLLAAVVVAAIAANIALLSVATGSHDPVGRLSPVVQARRGAMPPTRPTPLPPPVEHDEADD